MNLRTLKGQVEYTLKTLPATRNSDIALTISVWQYFYPSLVQDGKVALDNLFDLPREDSVKRIRAKFQNEMNLYLPTDEKVALARGFKEEEWRELLGYQGHQDTL